jgi:hypothetical protein
MGSGDLMQTSLEFVPEMRVVNPWCTLMLLVVPQMCIAKIWEHQMSTTGTQIVLEHYLGQANKLKSYRTVLCHSCLSIDAVWPETVKICEKCNMVELIKWLPIFFYLMVWIHKGNAYREWKEIFTCTD